MTITYPHNPPSTPGFESMTWRARGQRVLSVSPFSLAQQTVSWSGQQWEVDCQLPPMGIVQAEQWISWALALDGPVGTFELGDQANPEGQGTADDVMLLAGATAIGDKTIDMDAATISQVDVFKAGDWFHLDDSGNRQLFKVLQDVSADGAGALTVDVWPFVRYVFPNNDTVVYTTPKGLFRLQTNIIDWTVENLIYGFTFTAIEVIT